MNGLVLLEGPDSVGKTTLAEAIRARYGESNTDYIHLGYVKGGREMFRANYLALWRASKMMSMGKVVVMDRGWMSENVYAAIYRGKADLPFEAAMFDRVCQRLCAAQVVCVPTVDSAAKRHAACHKQREEMYEPGPQIRQVARRFREMLFGRGTKDCGDRIPDTVDYAQRLIDGGGLDGRADVVHYDIDKHGHDLPAIMEEIESVFLHRQATQFAPALDHERPNFLGHIRKAEFLFVGDRINPNKAGKYPLVDYGASSRVLTKVLHELKFDETRAVWCNANEDGMIDEIYYHKPALRVVTFGNQAEKRCATLPHDHVWHPSYVGRFAKQNEYFLQLAEILE